MENIVKINEISQCVAQALDGIKEGVRIARENGLQAELPTEVTFQMTVVKNFQSLEIFKDEQAEESGTQGGTTRDVSESTGTEKSSATEQGKDQSTGTEKSSATEQSKDQSTGTEKSSATEQGKDQSTGTEKSSATETRSESTSKQDSENRSQTEEGTNSDLQTERNQNAHDQKNTAHYTYDDI